MKKISISFFLGLQFWSFNLSGQDRIFNYVYQSGVLNKGEREIEIWTTYRTGREDYFRRMDTRVEFETGLSKRLQTAFYLNYSTKVEELVMDSASAFSKENEFSFSNEWKIKLSDQAANLIGSALYGEITLGPSQLELEARVIVDKQAGRLTHALNLAFEPEWEWEPERNEIAAAVEYKFEISYGVGFMVGRGWSLGVEISNPNVYLDDHWAHSALYAGPTISFMQHGFWANLSLMPQVAGLRGKTPGQDLNLSEFERYQGRLLFSFAL